MKKNIFMPLYASLVMLLFSVNACKKAPEVFPEAVSQAPSATSVKGARVAASLESSWDLNRVLRNPDKGFYHHYYDNAINKYLLGSDSDLLNFPGMDHIYLRLAWSYFEPTEGQYNWSYIDNMVSAWASRGYKFSLRVTCKETSITYATPEWVKNAGAKGKFVDNYGTQRWEPDYGDPIFLQKLDNFHKAMAARYNGAAWLSYVDIGSLGDWGEGHTNPSSNVPISVAITKKHVDMYVKYYTSTQLVVSDDIPMWRRPAAEASEMRTYVESRGITYRDDSILVKGYVTSFPSTFSVEYPAMYDNMAANRPTILETQHYHMIKADGNWVGTNGATKGASILKGAIRTMRATYVGYHGNANTWLTENPQLAREIANLCGYWFLPKSAAIGDLSPGGTTTFEMTINNRGVARAYQRYNCYLKLVNTSTAQEYNFSLSGFDNRQWQPGQDFNASASITLPSSIPTGTYSVRFGMKREVSGQTTRPVEIGLKETLRKSDGYYEVIGSVTVGSGGGGTQPLANGLYKLTSKVSVGGTPLRVLNIKDGADVSGTAIELWQDLGTSAQQWYVQSTGDGYYKLVCQVGTKQRLLTGENEGRGNATKVSIYWPNATDGGNNQRWKVESTGDGYYKLTTKASATETTKYCLDVDGSTGSSNFNGAKIQLWQDNGQNNQRWRFDPL